MLMGIIVWIATIIVVVKASGKANRWSKGKKVLVGIALFIPALLLVGAINLWIAISSGPQLSTGDILVTGVVDLVVLFILYFVYASVYNRFGNGTI